MDRRNFTQLAAPRHPGQDAGRSGAILGCGTNDGRNRRERHHQEAMLIDAELTDGPTLSIGMLLYPCMFLQNLVRPLTVFEALMNRDIHVLWTNLDPVGNDGAGSPALIPVKPTTTFDQCPALLDVLFVPGGVPGGFAMMEDRTVLDFLARAERTLRHQRMHRFADSRRGRPARRLPGHLPRICALNKGRSSRIGC